MKRIIGTATIAFLVSYNASAQHEHHNMQDTTKPKMQMSDTVRMDNMNMKGMHKQNMKMNKPMNHHMSMSHAYSLNLPIGRNGSGTGWLPDASPMYGYMYHTPEWMYMLHGNSSCVITARILPTKVQGVGVKLMHRTGLC